MRYSTIKKDPEVKEYLNEVDDLMRKTLQTHDISEEVKYILKYYLGCKGHADEEKYQYKGGKKIRALICLLIFQAITGSHKQALSLACGIELFHNCSLLLDDIEDRHFMRRGCKTVLALWGKKIAYDIAWNLKILSEFFIEDLVRLNISFERIERILREFRYMELRMYNGQCAERYFFNALNVGVEEYLKVCRQKTASLFEFAAYAAAELAQSSSALISQYKEFGLNVGIAHQIRDDLNEFSHLSIRIKQKKNVLLETPDSIWNLESTLPFLIAINKLSPKKKTYFKTLLRSRVFTTAQIEELLIIVKRSKGLDNAESLARHYSEKAVAAIKNTGIQNRAHKNLMKIACFLGTQYYM
jgi:geranylgeranyl pyrophosphate synthase